MIEERARFPPDGTPSSSMIGPAPLQSSRAGPRSSSHRFFLLVVGLSAAGPASSAVDWSLSKGIGASAIYSDNADTSDGEARGESVLAFSPFVRLDGRGRRSNVSLGARFELRRFVDEDRNEFAPQVTLASHTTLVERFAELDASARVSQRSSRTDPLVGEELTLFDETEEVYEFAIGPTIGSTFGKRSRYQASYRFGASRGSGDGVDGSDVHAVSARTFTALSGRAIVTAGGDYQVARFEGGDESRSELVGVGLGYRFFPTLLGFVSGGQDRIDSGGELTEGGFWNVGARWQPNARLIAQAGYGERAYGRNPSASLTLRGRRSTIVLAWSRQLAFAAGTVLTDDLLSPSGAATVDGATGDEADDARIGGSSTSGGVVGDEIDGGVEVDESLAPLGRDAGSIEETIRLGYALNGRRSTLSASATGVRREQLDTDLVTDGLRYGLGFRRTLSRRIEAAVDWTVLENDFSDERRRTRENRVRLAISVAL